MSKIIKSDYLTECESGFTPRTAMEEAARCLLCYDAPCSKGCPAGTDPAKFIRSIRFRNVKGAAETIRENNILGGSCARICPYDKMCEEACSRCGIDVPIQIGKLQRFAVEQEKLYNMTTLKVAEEKKKERVLCVGSGPSSLACAAELAKCGYDVTVMDKNEKAGGLLTYGIVPSRLPEEVVMHDIDQLKKLGVRFELGRKVTEKDTKAFDAVFMGTGLGKEKLPDIPGTDCKGVYTALSYLREARMKKEAFEHGAEVLVIGGGDTAVDCAVTAALTGAEKVRIVYRRTIGEAPANLKEFQYALSLGIGITTEMAPAQIVGEGAVEGMRFKGRDGSSELFFKADTVVFAVGQAAEDLSEICRFDTDESGRAIVDSSCMTSADGVFAAGDIVAGGNTVVEAVAGGKKAAQGIISYFETKGVK